MIVVAITGASGVIYGIRLLETLKDLKIENSLVISDAGKIVIESETDYTVSVYVLDEEAFAAGQAADSSYTMDKLWAYSKSSPKKDKYQSLIKVASCDVVKNEKTGEILSFTCNPVE